MNARILPLAEVAQRGTDALVKELGVVDTIRFLNQFRTRAGDYTADRDRLLEGLSVEEIVREIETRRKPS